jgi:hypothetical protein
MENESGIRNFTTMSLPDFELLATTSGFEVS